MFFSNLDLDLRLRLSILSILILQLGRHLFLVLSYEEVFSLLA